MAKKKTTEFRAVGFRLPSERYELLARVAEKRGIDLSALLNVIVADAERSLRYWLEVEEGGFVEECVDAAAAAVHRALPGDDGWLVETTYRWLVSSVVEGKRDEEALAAVKRYGGTTKGLKLSVEELARWVRHLLAVEGEVRRSAR